MCVRCPCIGTWTPTGECDRHILAPCADCPNIYKWIFNEFGRMTNWSYFDSAAHFTPYPHSLVFVHGHARPVTVTDCRQIFIFGFSFHFPFYNLLWAICVDLFGRLKLLKVEPGAVGTVRLLSLGSVRFVSTESANSAHDGAHMHTNITWKFSIEFHTLI